MRGALHKHEPAAGDFISDGCLIGMMFSAIWWATSHAETNTIHTYAGTLCFPFKVSGMAKERKLSDPGSSDPLDLQDMLVKLTSRVATLECFYGCDC